MPQQQRDAQDGAAGVGDAAPRDVRRGPVDGFIEPPTSVPERRRGQHAERAGEHRGLVGEDVAEQVLGQHHIEVARPAQQVHRGRVDQHVVQRHARELVADDTAAHLAPQARGLEHVRFVDLGDPAAASCGEAAGDAGDALHLGDRVLALIERGRALAPFAAEVDATGEFADEEQIDALEDLGLERRRIAQRRQHRDGPQVGVDAEFGAQAQQRGLGPHRRVRTPLRSADRAEQDGVRGKAARKRMRRQSVAVRVDRRSAEGKVFERELVATGALDGLQHAQTLGHHLGADAIAPKHRDARLHAGRRVS